MSGLCDVCSSLASSGTVNTAWASSAVIAHVRRASCLSCQTRDISAALLLKEPQISPSTQTQPDMYIKTFQWNSCIPVHWQANTNEAFWEQPKTFIFQSYVLNRRHWCHWRQQSDALSAAETQLNYAGGAARIWAVGALKTKGWLKELIKQMERTSHSYLFIVFIVYFFCDPYF